jgi:hypothetical protein
MSTLNSRDSFANAAASFFGYRFYSYFAARAVEDRRVN